MRKKIKYSNNSATVVITFITVFFVGCYFLFSNKTFKYCSNENYLLDIHETLPNISINYNQFRNELLEEISIKLKKETCCQTNEFLLQLENNETINVKLHNECKNCPIYINDRFYYRILLYKDNRLFLQDRPITLDSLSLNIYDCLKNEDLSDNVNFMFYWDKPSQKKTIENVFLNVKKGYQLYYEEMALQQFSKQLCKLSQKETEEIKRKKSSIYLGVGNRIFEPLPPPPPPKNN